MKMTKRWIGWFFASAFVFIIIFTSFLILRLKDQKSFMEIPLKNFSYDCFYYFDVEIENQKVSLLLDTGMDFTVSLQEETLKKIKNKQHIGFSEWYDINGNAYKTPCYTIDLMRLKKNKKKVNLKEVTVREQSLDDTVFGGALIGFNTKKTLLSSSSKRALSIKEGLDKKVGYFGIQSIRRHDYWLFDFLNSKMYYIVNLNDSLRRLNKSLDDFIEISPKNNQSHLAIDIDTDFGRKTFMIDTGADVTVMKSPSKEFPENQSVISKRFSVENFDFGKQEIYFYNFSEKFKYDGVLGLDFLRRKLILLDFENNRIFIIRKKHEARLKTTGLIVN